MKTRHKHKGAPVILKFERPKPAKRWRFQLASDTIAGMARAGLSLVVESDDEGLRMTTGAPWHSRDRGAGAM